MLNLVVLSCLMAAASAALLTPYAPLAYSGAIVAPWYGGNYRGPLSLAPGKPANILAVDGRPFDTLDVNLDRSAHLTAEALDGGLHLLNTFRTAATCYAFVAHSHIFSVCSASRYDSEPDSRVLGCESVKKRSARLAPLGLSRIAYAGAPLITHAAPLAYSAPIVAPYHTPLIHTTGHLAHYL